MSEEELKAAISAAVEEAFDKRPEPMLCSLGLDREEHEKQHQFLDSLISASDKLDKIKWGFIGTLIKSTGWFVIGLIGVGAYVWIKAELTKVGG